MATATYMPTHALEQLTRAPVVVVANDQEWASRSIESLLAPRGYAVRRVSSGREALELVRAVQPDALIVDARTQDLGAVEICNILRGDPRISPALPIIVTANDGSARADRLEVLGAGAWDYCTQPIDGEMLLLKLATFLRAKQELDRLIDECLVDELTGLYTFRGLARRAMELGAQANRRQESVSCVAFAPVRDSEPPVSTHGTAVNTKSLVERIAFACRKHGRVSDVFGRVGTTEFAILAPGTDDRGAAALIGRLQSAIGETLADREAGPRSHRLIAGITSVRDFSQSNVDVMEMLLRATDELRRKRAPALADSP